MPAPPCRASGPRAAARRPGRRCGRPGASAEAGKEAASGRRPAQEQGGGEAQKVTTRKSQAACGASCPKCRMASNSSSRFGIPSPIWVSFRPLSLSSFCPCHSWKPSAIPSRPPGPTSRRCRPQPRSHLTLNSHRCLFFETFPSLLGITDACAHTFSPEKPSSLAKSQSSSSLNALHMARTVPVAPDCTAQ